jgi:hypothetical protein
MKGGFTFSPSVPQIVDASGGIVLLGPVVAPLDSTGSFSVALLATDAPGTNPTGWTYEVAPFFLDAPAQPFSISLPHAAPSVSLPAITPVTPSTGTYVVVTGPQGPAGPQGPTGPAGSGGGSTIKTASVRITDDNLSGLPSAPSWAIAQTSAGTKLQCSIAASSGDRVLIDPNFMRVGSHYLDFAMLDSSGNIAQYLSTGTSSPGPEGSPVLYPSTAFEYGTSTDMVVVGSGDISAGQVTIALVHQGTGSGTVYAHPTYPWRMRLSNIGPEPA